MNRLLLAGAAGLLVCLLAHGPAHAQAGAHVVTPVKVVHRTFNLKTLLSRGMVIMTPRDGSSITVRAPRTTTISRQAGGMTGHFTPLQGRLNQARSARLFDVSFGNYYASPQNRQFRVDPSCFIQPARR